jgi:hypothetical protein
MNYANAEPQLSDITPFALSSELLRLTVLTCGGMSLGKAIGQSSLPSSHGGCYGTQATEGSHQLATPSSSAKFPYPMSALKQTHGWNYSTSQGEGDVEMSRESGRGSHDTVTLQQLQVQISGIHFVRDGILMSASMIWGPLLRYILMETKRREGAGVVVGPNQSSDQLPDDIDKLVTTLQRSENHLLAARVILSTWSAYQGKKQVHPPPSRSPASLPLSSLFPSLLLSSGTVLLHFHDGVGQEDHHLSRC